MIIKKLISSLGKVYIIRLFFWCWKSCQNIVGTLTPEHVPRCHRRSSSSWEHLRDYDNVFVYFSFFFLISFPSDSSELWFSAAPLSKVLRSCLKKMRRRFSKVLRDKNMLKKPLFRNKIISWQMIVMLFYLNIFCRFSPSKSHLLSLIL